MNKLKVFDLFTGIAGFTLGIIRALGKENVGIVGFGDNEKDPIAINKYNFKEVTNYEDGEPLPDFDLLVGGSPCQDVSTAGKRKGICGKRSRLFFYFIKLLKEKQPTNFIFENVKGLLSSNKGWDFARVQNELSKAGYDIEWQLLDSKNFGVPQHRERIYIIGHFRGKSRPKVFPIKTLINENRKIKIKIKDKFQKTIYDITGIAPTLREGHGDVIRIQGKNGKYRKLSPIECERLQGFPDNWTKYGTNEKGKCYEIANGKRYKALGNAITVNIVETIIRRLYE